MKGTTVLSAVVISGVTATILYALSGHHPAWDSWPWNFGCFMAAILGIDLLNGKRITLR